MSRPRAATSVATSRSALPSRKSCHHAIALPLLHAAVQRLGAVAVRVERLDERLDFEPRAAEDERGRRVLHVEHALERRRLVRARDDVGDLAHARQLARRRSSRARSSRAPGSCRCRCAIARIRAGIVAEKSAVCRVLGRRLEDRVEILGEAHVEHLVGFVEHEHRAACRASACRGGCDRARGPAWRRRRRRRARARGSAACIGAPP